MTYYFKTAYDGIGGVKTESAVVAKAITEQGRFIPCSEGEFDEAMGLFADHQLNAYLRDNSDPVQQRLDVEHPDD